MGTTLQAVTPDVSATIFVVAILAFIVASGGVVGALVGKLANLERRVVRLEERTQIMGADVDRLIETQGTSDD